MLRFKLRDPVPEPPTVGEPYQVTTVFEADDRLGVTHRFACTYTTIVTREWVAEQDQWADGHSPIKVRKARVKCSIDQVIEDGHDVTGLLHSGIRYQLQQQAEKRERALNDIRHAEAA